MEKMTQRADDEPGLLSFDSFFSHTFTYCVDSFNTCSSSNADKRCVLLGLCLLSATTLLISCLVLMQQRCRSGGNPGESCVFSYCFLGNLCSTVGAILSKQLHIQVLMGVIAAALDAVNILSCCFSVYLCRNSKKKLRVRMMRRRRRQHLLAVCVLMVVAGGFLKSFVNPSGRSSGRRLLQTTLQDHTEVLGYVLGLISFVIFCTARFPALCRTEGEVLTMANLISRLLCSLAGSLYAAAILLYDTQTDFLLRVMPWLLSAICCSILDVLIVVFHFCRRGSRQQLARCSSDTQRLLGVSDVPAVEKYFMNITKGKVKTKPETKKKNVANMTEMGQYMDVSLHPVCCLHEVSLSQEETEDKPHDGTLPVMTVHGSCFSDLSCDSSSVSTDLEGGFNTRSGDTETLELKTPSAFQYFSLYTTRW